MKDANLSVSANAHRELRGSQKAGLGLSVAGILMLLLAWAGITFEPIVLFTVLSFGLIIGGLFLYTYGTYAHETKGIKNNFVWFNSLTNRGVIAWIAGILLTAFYIQLYFYGTTLGMHYTNVKADQLELTEGATAESVKQDLTASHPDALEISVNTKKKDDVEQISGAKIRTANTGFIHVFDPISRLLRGKPADQWFLYGTLYTFVILFLGIKFMVKYRHNRYQFIRTVSVVLAQLVFAYFLPQILESFYSGTPYIGRDLKSIWPLEYKFATPDNLNSLQTQNESGVSGTFYFVLGVFLFLIFTPLLTWLVGKRWYCSWVCGCGGLAETGGDSFRQLSSKSLFAWRLERVLIHSVMVFVLVMSIATLYPYFTGNEYELGFIRISGTAYFIGTLVLLVLAITGVLYAYFSSKSRNKWLLTGAVILFAILVLVVFGKLIHNQRLFFISSRSLKKVYGFLIGATFSGVIGVGFYPILGNRVWCRFGCPMAGYMGIFQRFKSRFRITTNGGQCISCGNCSVYCEQGIDVRAYAQKGENIVRSSCVGCGICSAVCPRGVLKLENGPESGRIIENPKMTGIK